MIRFLAKSLTNFLYTLEPLQNPLLVFSLGEEQTKLQYIQNKIAPKGLAHGGPRKGGCTTAGVLAPTCGFRQSTETHV